VTDVVDTLFDEFVARWARGERPDAADYLDRAGPARAELARMLDRYLAVAPAPEPDEATLRFAELVAAGEPPLLAARVARGLTRRDLVGRLLGSLGIGREKEKEEKARRYWHELEVGRRTPADVAPELWRCVVELLGPAAEAARGWRPAVGAEPAATFLRVQDQRAGAPPAAPPAAAAPDEERDDIDRLFGYGR
jgi:hypothetical protein